LVLSLFAALSHPYDAYSALRSGSPNQRTSPEQRRNCGEGPLFVFSLLLLRADRS
jgi:hypothetical protein